VNLARIVERNAADHGARVAVEFGDERIRYADLAHRVDRAAAALAGPLGVGRGDRVAWLGHNHPEMLVLLFALARLGAVLVPLNFRLALPEHRYILGHAGAHVLIAERAFVSHLAPLTREVLAGSSALALVALADAPSGWLHWGELLALPAVEPGVGGSDADPVLLVYTSGTTGRPKGVVLSQANLLWNIFNAVHVHEMTSADRVLTNLPLFHVGGLNIQTLPALYAGARVCLHPRFDPAATLAAIASFRPTLTLVVPATLRAIVEHPDFATTPLTSLRMMMTGSMTTPDSLIAAVHRRGVPVGQVYGATETAPVAICLRREDAFAHVGSVGKPAPHTEVRLVKQDGTEAATGDEGEIWVRGPHVMREYWDDPQLTASAFVLGWYRTGDVGVADRDGFIRVSGRLKEMIISGGENIYPAELESILADCPEIAEAVVVGIADRRWGEVPVACVVRREGAKIDESAVLSLFDGRLARYKHPHRVVFVESLPHNAMGKVQRHAIRLEPQGGG
jgi:fatty-acyl-CoA synthase